MYMYQITDRKEIFFVSFEPPKSYLNFDGNISTHF